MKTTTHTSNTASQVVLTCQNVSFQRGKRNTLCDVSLTVHAGEIVALVGPNGAGKSTLLSVASGDLRPSQGSVEILGQDISTLSVRDLAHRRAVLTQSNNVGFQFTVQEVVEMGRAPWARTAHAEEDREAVSAAIKQMDIEAFTSKFYSELSGGERARVSMARVLAQRTPLIMLDEPTAAMDIRHQERLMRVVRAHTRTGVGAIVVLHDLGLAAAYADTVVILSEGRVVAQGKPRNVFTADRLSSVYQTPVTIVDDGSGSCQVVPDRSHVCDDE